MKVLVVCHGNINRSPLCAAILREQQPSWEVREAALKAWEKPSWKPERASKKMRDAALELGFNLEAHRSTAITAELLSWADAVIFMDQGNYKRAKAIEEQTGIRVKALYCLASFEGKSRIPDPAFIARGTQEFHDVVKLIHDCSISAAAKMIANPF